jgi:microcystin-dependent protein
MSQPFLGDVRAFGFNFAPKGWARCDGQILSIAQNTALFSLLGTNYGGNGTTNFALPDLRSRAPIGFGQGPGLSSYFVGQVGGSTTVTLSGSHLATHTHTPTATSNPGDQRDPFSITPQTGHRWAGSGHPQYSGSGPNVAMNSTLVGPAGGGAPHPNESPYLTVLFCIAVSGVFPARN